ncbi:uncharacterized protein I206_105854 [Kwoniella pini CBS 10737]|uniref:Ribonuclease H2 subunit B n=1 Tax=Kwoniella pini CBS 10737 TaxID=1296096 RepID=A0A1B9I0C9_9TREE|nr:uncharacterized protein I206_04674 [Kwoniella pini CBS 10737]OCF48987.1 hypothetical protein I206_04674 [Kwoniella pini CBS 10737]
MEYISVIKDDVDLSKSQRYLRIPHSRTGQAQLYLPYTNSDGQESILELIKLNGSQRRTWFIGDSGIDAGNILVHYPMDPLFLVIPIVLALSNSNNAQSFQPFSDLISTASSLPSFTLPEPFTGPIKPGQSSTGYNRDLESLLKLKIIRKVLRACCEKKVIPSVTSSPSSKTTEQKYYRPSIPMILNHLKKKVEHFAQPEEFEKFDHLVRGLSKDGLLGDDYEELRNLSRIQASIDHLSQWLPREITQQLLNSYDFTALSIHVKNRTAASIAASQQPKNTSNKDKDVKGTKRKAPTSKGVEALKKVNTNSMNKLTSFFKPKEGKKK